MNIQQLVENKKTLDYQAICTTLIQIFGVEAKINWESVLPAQQQQDYFGGEALRLIADHPILSKQKDIRPICLKKGNTSQMLFMYVSLKDATLPKKDIQDIGKKFISGGDANRYIIWFFGNTENSQLKVVLSGKEGKKVVLKTLPFGVNQPYYKTYNFILTEVNTQVNQLFVEPTELWKALWKAFDISVVNRNFYKEIKAAFDELMQKELPQGTTLFKTQDEKVQFAIRLIGRIIFCWFLKRKGIVKEDVLASQVAREKNSYYHELLAVLFFEVFNTAHKERKAGLPPSIANYPFLNGGLFEAQSNDFKGNVKLTISNEWFYRLFALTLEKYNFTVDENSSNNAEIAIDPEMLGRIFENLLAEQNPETGESARKATGSFYTPREIVDYMVEQSIIEYLKTSLGAEEIVEKPLEENLFGVVPLQQLSLPKVIDKDLPENWEEMIADFVHTLILPKGLQKHEKDLNKALNQVKVLDPACGSGAFPMGVLQKLVALKQVLRPNEKPYQLKLSTIQQSIYGVDIQPMAVELSRLRCWLSLVVDEEVENIKPLPYLDFKFVCADSLVDVPHFSGKNDPKLQELLKEFQKETEAYFDCAAEKKVQRKTALNDIVKKIIKYNNDLITKHNIEIAKESGEKNRKHAAAKLNMNLEGNKSEPLIVAENQEKYQKKNNLREKNAEILVQSKLLWESFMNIFEGKKVGFFNVEYFFPAAKEGFDVVIGNPPYVSLHRLNMEGKKAIQQENYETYENTGDIYSIFYERGYKLLSKLGVLCYITSRQWMHAGYGKSLRAFLAKKTNPVALIDFGQTKIFEGATVFVNILLLSTKRSPFQGCLIEPKDIWKNNLAEIVQEKLQSIAHIDENTWKIDNSKAINDRIESKGKSLAEYEAEGFVLINRGITTGYNDAFHIQAEKKKELIAKDPKNAEIIKPLLRGKDIKRYGYVFEDWYIINVHNGVREKEIPAVNVMQDYPIVYEHLQKYEESLVNRQDQGQHWTNLRNCAFLQEFENPKIVWIEISDRANYTYDDKGMYLTNSAYFLTCSTDKFSLKYLLAILNSQLSDYYFSQFTAKIAGGRMRYTKQYVEKVIIPDISPQAQKPFETLVDYILYLKAANITDTHDRMMHYYFSHIIDMAVYEVFFPVEMHEAGFEVLKYLEDLPTNPTFEEIKAIHARFQDVKHPIRNAVSLLMFHKPFSTIKEALHTNKNLS